VCVCVCFCVCVCRSLSLTHTQTKHTRRVRCTTVSTENAANHKSANPRNSDFLVSRGTNSNWDFGFIWIRTEEFEFLVLMDFLGVQHFQRNLSCARQVGGLINNSKEDPPPSTGLLGRPLAGHMPEIDSAGRSLRYHSCLGCYFSCE